MVVNVLFQELDLNHTKLVPDGIRSTRPNLLALESISASLQKAQQEILVFFSKQS